MKFTSVAPPPSDEPAVVFLQDIGGASDGVHIGIRRAGASQLIAAITPQGRLRRIPLHADTAAAIGIMVSSIGRIEID